MTNVRGARRPSAFIGASAARVRVCRRTFRDSSPPFDGDDVASPPPRIFRRFGAFDRERDNATLPNRGVHCEFICCPRLSSCSLASSAPMNRRDYVMTCRFADRRYDEFKCYTFKNHDIEAYIFEKRLDNVQNDKREMKISSRSFVTCLTESTLLQAF